MLKRNQNPEWSAEETSTTVCNRAEVCRLPSGNGFSGRNSPRTWSVAHPCSACISEAPDLRCRTTGRHGGSRDRLCLGFSGLLHPPATMLQPSPNGGMPDGNAAPGTTSSRDPGCSCLRENGQARPDPPDRIPLVRHGQIGRDRHSPGAVADAPPQLRDVGGASVRRRRRPSYAVRTLPHLILPPS